jgi:hypothetical protein
LNSTAVFQIDGAARRSTHFRNRNPDAEGDGVYCSAGGAGQIGGDDVGTKSPRNLWVGFWLARAEEVQFRLCTARLEPCDGSEPAYIEPAKSRARDAINILSTAPTSFFRWRRRRAHLESSLGDIHVAKLGLLHATPTRELRAHLPEFAQVAAECLPASDLRRKSLEDLNAKSQFDDTGEGPQDRIRILGTVSDAMRASYAEFERRQLQLFNFAIVVYVAAAIMMTLVICIVAFGFIWPDKLNLCFVLDPRNPNSQLVCPTGGHPDRWDHLIVATAGLLGATIAAAISLRRLVGARTLGIAIALLVLKLPSGALTATLGILLMRAAFVPGLTALDTSAQIVAWSVVFGYAQQLFTNIVDGHAQGLVQSAEHPNR